MSKQDETPTVSLSLQYEISIDDLLEQLSEDERKLILTSIWENEEDLFREFLDEIDYKSKLPDPD